VLHANGPVRVRVQVTGGQGVRLAVLDESPIVPAVRDYDTAASTGRGLGLIARLAKRWGVEPAEGHGKAVWCELVDDADAIIARPLTELPEALPPVGSDAAPVTFTGVPVAAYLRLQEQNDAVLRELALLAFTADLEGNRTPSPDLLDVIERARRYFSAHREGFRREVGEAALAGVEVIDLTGLYAPASLELAGDYVDLFERAEELARRDELLVAPPDHDVARLRRWFIAEMAAQLLEGAAPRPFDSGN